jgi:hypothetical protein
VRYALMRPRFRLWISLALLVCCKHPATKSETRATASASAGKAAPTAFGAFDLTSTDIGAALIAVDATGVGLSLTRFGWRSRPGVRTLEGSCDRSRRGGARRFRT